MRQPTLKNIEVIGLADPSCYGEVHISSFIVYCTPNQLRKVEQYCHQYKNLEVAKVTQEGKLILCFECVHETEIKQLIQSLEKLAGVMNVSMVYHAVNEGGDNETNA